MKPFWLLVTVLVGGCAAPPQVRIGSKSDVEGGILGRMMAQLVSHAGVRAGYERLGGTQIVWQALRNGEIDAYPEYTGTLSQEIFAGRGLRGEEALRAELAQEGIRMTKPLGFNNAYALGMKEEVAGQLGIRTISDLRRHPALKLGLSNEFMGRKDDGWPNLRARYELPHPDVRGLDHSLAYRALDSGDIQVTDLYTTDAEIRAHNLRVLRDDLAFFPAYQAVLLYRADLETRFPKAAAALRQLEGRISETAMMDLNARVQIDRVREGRVAADFLTQSLGIQTDPGDETDLWLLLRNTWDHLFLVVVSLSAGIVIAVPLGIWAAHRPGAGQVILGTVGILQTIPSLALLVFMMPLLTALNLSSTGALPAILALFLYSLLPMVRNTYTGLHDIPPHLRESAEAIGLPPLARLRLIELPLASRSILAGIKTAAVINVGYATLGALIGAGGYGQPIVTGIQLRDTWTVIWHGAVPAAVMALAVQGVFEVVERVCVPKGLRLQGET